MLQLPSLTTLTSRHRAYIINTQRLWGSNPYYYLERVVSLPIRRRRHNAFGWNRTTDTGIFSPLLYRLSYEGIYAGFAPMHQQESNLPAMGIELIIPAGHPVPSKAPSWSRTNHKLFCRQLSRRRNFSAYKRLFPLLASTVTRTCAVYLNNLDLTGHLTSM